MLLSALPRLQLVDLTHDVSRHDVLGGALLLEACVPWFPAGTVHLAVVDPGVGTARRPVAVRDAAGRLLVGPDNGLFTPFLEGRRGAAPHPGWSPPGPGLAPPSTAGTCSRPRPPAWPGEASWPSWAREVVDPVRLPWPRARREGQELHGECLRADPFGNVVTSITVGDLGGQGVASATVGGHVARAVETYGEGEPGEPLVLLGSSGRLEVAIREGDAARELALERGTPVVVRLA